jgi:hypothetical protein
LVHEINWFPVAIGDGWRGGEYGKEKVFKYKEKTNEGMWERMIGVSQRVTIFFKKSFQYIGYFSLVEQYSVRLN